MKGTRGPFVAEFLGTFALCFIGIGAVCADQWTGTSAIGLVGIALAHGTVLAVMISALGHISGGHFNPAVTIGILAANRIESKKAIGYILAQLAGAIMAAALLKFLMPQDLWGAVHGGAPMVDLSVPIGKAILLEAVLTFFLVLTVFGTAVDPKGSWNAIAGFGIGTVLVFDILVGGPITGAAMNPARAFGPALVSGLLNPRHLVYWFGPMLGGLAASYLYTSVFLTSKPR